MMVFGDYVMDLAWFILIQTLCCFSFMLFVAFFDIASFTTLGPDSSLFEDTGPIL